ncbi:hypothetical protein JWG42_07860 [Desulfoprunum benzoelyticum]|jgi:hypothetical protein|uniref:Uncharacterized protein n=1 Tax=Desulfoprunum benzoelyticum TaxID=1506996 RepID=A0A840V4J6_9BACT|nr:hypothetical protein [Desulfoprunum benzoelyticum]MBB5348659.1 hypothetical protein [Desulfoprunum benzoelyticum]MBM9530061.1 hypothetical protein [Desulfoprunum benzoelyticum]
MTENEFQHNLGAAQTLSAISEYYAFVSGYILGLYRHFHGSSFGAEAEHQQYLALDGDDDQREFARGYRAGFAGESAEAIAQKLMMGS